MYYTVREAAKRLNLSPHTIRFYAKDGLLTFVAQDQNGNRIFKESAVRPASRYTMAGLFRCLYLSIIPETPVTFQPEQVEEATTEPKPVAGTEEPAAEAAEYITTKSLRRKLPKIPIQNMF